MNRRGFLKAFGIGAVGVAATPAILEALEPTRSIFLPPRCGWLAQAADIGRARIAYEEKIHENLVQATGIPARYLFGEVANAGVPQFLVNYIDPKLIEILLLPIAQLQLEGWLDV